MNFPKINYKNGNRPALMSDLRKSIDAYFAERKTNRFANRRMKIKMAAIFLLFAGSYIMLLCAGHSFAVYLTGMCLFGFSSALIAFNIGHDASHGALSQKKWVNKLFSYSFNLVGVNSYIWNLKHNISHHAYTNMPGLDMDIQQVKIARLVPTMPLRKMHRYQHIYVPLLYPFASLFLIFIKDFMLFSGTQFGKKHPRREYIVLIVTKLFYFGYAILLPFLLVDLPVGEMIAGMLCMHLMLGVFVAVILFPVHAQEDSRFHSPDEKGNVASDWAAHQIESTTNFAADSRIMNWISGGLNTHIIHHLFPGICHIHYYALTKIIREVSARHGILFRDRTLAETLAEHRRFLKLMGRAENESASRLKIAPRKVAASL